MREYIASSVLDPFAPLGARALAALQVERITGRRAVFWQTDLQLRRLADIVTAFDLKATGGRSDLKRLFVSKVDERCSRLDLIKPELLCCGTEILCVGTTFVEPAFRFREGLVSEARECRIETLDGATIDHFADVHLRDGTSIYQIEFVLDSRFSRPQHHQRVWEIVRDFLQLPIAQSLNEYAEQMQIASSTKMEALIATITDRMPVSHETARKMLIAAGLHEPRRRRRGSSDENASTSV